MGQSLGSLSWQLALQTEMKLSVVLLSLAVLGALVLPEAEGAVARRRGGRRGRVQARTQRRRGRQEEEAADDYQDLDDAASEGGSGEELPNGCDPATNIGGFLVFNGVKVWCGEQGITDFGPYGGLPAEDGSGAASDDTGVEVEAPEEEAVRRARKARARKGKQTGKGKKQKKQRQARKQKQQKKQKQARRGKANRAGNKKKQGLNRRG